ncbi:hypothetical protein BDV93DRAFT_555159 [Ceratobasidium sp. AG-I]|nr:hypothetical protein BDV93DRAFT_555159 [Ceratobasidium sp. AG-I]
MSQSPSVFARLPTEIMIHIFLLATSSNQIIYNHMHPYQQSMDPTNSIASVCARWRYTALATSSLWSSLDAGKQGAYHHIALRLKRSKGYSLDIRAIFQPLLIGSLSIALPLVLPHFDRLRSLHLCANTEVLEQWLSSWFDCGTPGALSSIALSTCGTCKPLSFPTHTMKNQPRLRDLLSSVDALFLSRIVVDWDRFTFQSLVALNLRDLAVSLPIYVIRRLLLASPSLQCLQLAHLTISDVFDSTQQSEPIQLNHLHTLEISQLNVGAMHMFLSMLTPSTNKLTLKIDFCFSWAADSAFRSEFISFCSRSNITTLYCAGPGILYNVAVAMPNLEVLVLKGININRDLCNSIAPPAKGTTSSPRGAGTPWPQLHTIEMIGCVIVDLTSFRRVLTTCPVRRLGADKGCFNMFTKGAGECQEGWSNPNLRFSSVRRDWTIGYAPLGCDVDSIGWRI